MTTNFPTSIDSYSAHSDGVNEVISAATINALQDAVAALEAKAGITSSADTASLDYKVAHAAAGGSGSSMAVALGDVTMHRSIATTSNTSTITAGTMHLQGFVPQASFTASKIRYFSTAGTSPTAGYVGLYSINAAGAGTLIAVSANQGSGLGTNAVHSVAFVTPVALTAGSAYAVALLNVGAASCIVTTAAAVNVFVAGNITTGPMCIQPFYAALLAGQTTLPASFTFASLTTTGVGHYCEILV